MTYPCPDCQSPMVLRSGGYGNYLQCSKYPQCRGSQNATPFGEPKGVPTDTETKQARILAHRVFDPLWRTGGMARGDAYRWLSEAMGIAKGQCHIANFDKDQCLRVVEICRSINQEPDVDVLIGLFQDKSQVSTRDPD